VQAYRFAQARLRAALLTAEPDLAGVPLRRSAIALFAGVMVAVLVVCGVGIFGVLRPGNKKGWDAQGVLVQERETGSRFVYDARDAALHPVLNYTSARLILDTKDVTLQQFARSSLKDVRRGAPRGLAGLPDALAPVDGLVRGPWVVCSFAGGSTAPPSLRISIGTQPAGHRVTGAKALLLRSESGQDYLVWNDTRLLIPDPAVVLPALQLDGAAPLPVSSTWLNTVVPGPDLKPPLPLNLGTAVPYKVGQQTVFLGQVFKVAVEGGLEASYYVVLKDGLSKISNVVALLLLGDPAMKYAYGNQSPHAYTAASADVNATPKSTERVGVDGLPKDVPQVEDPPVDSHGQPVPPQVCAAYTDTTGSTVSSAVYLSGSTAAAAGAPSPAVQVHLAPGTACLARLLPHSGQPSDAVFLITDLGARYAIPAPHVQEVLGYGGVTPVPVPNGILDLVPSGPVLDQSVADVDLSVTAPSPAAGS